VSSQGGRRRYTIYGGTASHRPEEGTDFTAIESGAISVTPMHFDLTDVERIAELERMSLADPLQVDVVPPGV
jgi:broad specificity polyphosphatase/5'/3'-nucleotidase SurE